jgi:hypothetical protein
MAETSNGTEAAEYNRLAIGCLPGILLREVERIPIPGGLAEEY